MLFFKKYFSYFKIIQIKHICLRDARILTLAILASLLINNIMRLFVGNLPWSIGDDELRDLFSEFGEVTDSKVINDRETGRSRGFGFIEIDDDGGEAAIKGLDGSEQEGRDIRVNVAEERKPRDNNRGGGGDRRDNNRW